MTNFQRIVDRPSALDAGHPVFRYRGYPLVVANPTSQDLRADQRPENADDPGDPEAARQSPIADLRGSRIGKLGRLPGAIRIQLPVPIDDPAEQPCRLLHVFDSAEHFADTIKRYVKVYNQHIPQKALGHSPPLQAMKNWSQKQPNCSKNVSIILRDLI